MQEWVDQSKKGREKKKEKRERERERLKEWNALSVLWKHLCASVFILTLSLSYCRWVHPPLLSMYLRISVFLTLNLPVYLCTCSSIRFLPVSWVNEVSKTRTLSCSQALFSIPTVIVHPSFGTDTPKWAVRMKFLPSEWGLTPLPGACCESYKWKLFSQIK